MDSDQRLEALRKAYADVILNTSKEAAARVMAAERKAEQLEQEIRGMKDEGVRLMVRLKRKMDDEMSKANMTTQNQQEKIDELEAQLQEAEDIVTELREQLRHEQAKFDRVTRRGMQHLDKHDNATREGASDDHRQSQSIVCPPLEFQKDSLVASYKKSPYLNQRTECPKSSGEPEMRSLYGAMPELPSIILRSKKHKLYRNASTQRIHACERNILDNKLSLSRQPDDASGKGKVEGAKKDNSACKDTFNEVHKMFNIESKEVVGKKGNISCCYEDQPLKLISKEVKNATKYRTHTLHRKNRSTETCVNDKEGDPDKWISKVIPPVKTPTKRRKSNGVLHSDPSSKSVGKNLQPNEDPTLVMPKLSLDIAGMETQPECVKTTQANNNGKEGDTGKSMFNGEPPVNSSVPFVHEGASAESSDIYVSKSNLSDERILQSKIISTDATSKGSSLQLFKYTYQRKRKRGIVSISDGDVPADNKTPEKRKETQNTSEEPEKSSLVADSSLESRL